jgi:putative Mn2+ efflux pump MntP
MQLIGFFLGSGFQVIGRFAPFIGFGALAVVGIYMLIESYKESGGFKVDSHVGLLTTSLSISLDSLGVGFAIPAVPLPFPPLIGTVACTTVLFTFAGLAFGSRLGEWIEKGAERIAGVVLVILAVVFATEHVLSGR